MYDNISDVNDCFISFFFPLWQDGITKTKEVLGMIYLLWVSHIICGTNISSECLKMFCFADTVMKIYIKTMIEDDDKEVVAQACMAVADIMKDFGYMAVEPCKCAHFDSFRFSSH